MKEIFKAVQDASRELLALTEEQINEILLAVADATIANAAYILTENQKDLARMDVANPKYDRLY